MIKGIQNKEFNFLSRALPLIKKYPGGTAKELQHNIKFTMHIDTPDTVVTRKNQENFTEEETVKEIISIDVYC